MGSGTASLIRCFSEDGKGAAGAKTLGRKGLGGGRATRRRDDRGEGRGVRGRPGR